MQLETKPNSALIATLGRRLPLILDDILANSDALQARQALLRL